MEGAKEKIARLLEEGKSFTYNNFATKGEYGYPNVISPNWITWATRVRSTIEKIFGEDSPSVRLARSAAFVTVLGNGPDKFEKAQSYYLSALSAGIEALNDDTFGEIINARESAAASRAFSNKVFVVHGHDDIAKQELEILLAEMGLEPVVLHRQADGGRTIIEKFEHYSDVGFACILMTPDEVAYLVGQANKPEGERKVELRARPNVIFEFGFFVGRLGRDRTCCIYRGDVAIPSDLSGLIYKKFEHSVEEIAWALAREMRAAGYVLK